MKYLRLLLQHSEKIIFFCLLAAFVILSFNLIAKIRKETNRPNDHFLVKALQKKTKLEDDLFSDKVYKKLKQALTQPESYLSEHGRDLFNEKVTQKVIIDDPEIIRPKVTIEDSDQDGMPDTWENKYGLDPDNPFDAKQDKDHDGFINLDEYIAGTDPTDQESFPGKLKLKVEDIYKKRVRIKFLGYSQEPDGSYKIQINWADRSYFLTLGQKIRGYTILDFTKDFAKTYNPLLGAEEVQELSFIRIQKKDEDPLKLIIGKPSYEKELFAQVKDQLTGKLYHLHNGSTIKSYEVLDITPSKVIIERNEKKYTLFFERSK